MTKYSLSCTATGGYGQKENYGGTYENMDELNRYRAMRERTYSGWNIQCSIETIEDIPIFEPIIPLNATHLIRLNIEDTSLVHALVKNRDFNDRINNLTQMTGYKLVNVYSLYTNEIRIEVIKEGSWNILKLVGAILGILAIVVASILGLPAWAALAVVGGAFFAIHYVVESLLTNETIENGMKTQKEAIGDLMDLIPEIQNNPNLTPEEKSVLIADIYNKTSELLQGIGENPIPIPPPGGGGGSGGGVFDKIENIILLVIVAGAAFMLFNQMKNKQ